MSMFSRRSAGLACVLALAVGVGVATVASGDNGTATSRSPTATAPVDQVNPVLAGEFAVLRSAPEVAPPQVQADFADLLPSVRAGLNLDLAQAVLTPASPTPVWVIPGDGWACIWIKDPVDGAGIVCDPDAKIQKSGLIVTLARPDESGLTAAGVLPDAARDITLQGPQGAVSVAKSPDGSFGVRDADVTAISFAVDGVSSSVSLGLSQAPG